MGKDFSKIKVFGVTWGVIPQSEKGWGTSFKAFGLALLCMAPALFLMRFVVPEGSHILARLFGIPIIVMCMIGSLLSLRWLNETIENSSSD